MPRPCKTPLPCAARKKLPGKTCIFIACVEGGRSLCADWYSVELVIQLIKLAVDLQHQGAGLGKALLKDALLRTLPAKPEFKVQGIWASPASRPACF